jgi:DNA-binding phage protein
MSKSGRRGEDKSLTLQLREAIRASGRSLRDLESTTGINRSQISRFLRGERDLTLTTAEQLIKALGLKLVIEPPAKPTRPGKGK